MTIFMAVRRLTAAELAKDPLLVASLGVADPSSFLLLGKALEPTGRCP